MTPTVLMAVGFSMYAKPLITWRSKITENTMRWPHLLIGLMVALPATTMGGQDKAPAQPKDKDIGKSFAIPFRLTESGHIMVRAKINGKGPYNFIVDTGAPLIFVSKEVAEKLGIKAEAKGMNTLESFQVEGGPAHPKFKCIIDTPPQLEGINALGLAGAEINGIIGYTLLAHYKMEIDLTKDRMTWTKLDFKPPVPVAIGDKVKDGGELDAMGKMVKQLAALIGSKAAQPPAFRGFFGIQLEEKDKGVFVKEVLEKGPAAKAGVLKGDRILTVDGKKVATVVQVSEILAKTTPGTNVVFAVGREGGNGKEIIITAGEGL